MIVNNYHITHLDTAKSTWCIDLEFDMCWYDRLFFGNVFPKQDGLVGNGMVWHWKTTGDRTNFFWSLWAMNVTVMNQNRQGAYYVNCRTNRSKNERNHQDSGN